MELSRFLPALRGVAREPESVGEDTGDADGAYSSPAWSGTIWTDSIGYDGIAVAAAERQVWATLRYFGLRQALHDARLPGRAPIMYFAGVPRGSRCLFLSLGDAVLMLMPQLELCLARARFITGVAKRGNEQIPHSLTWNGQWSSYT